ncbi:MAG: metalloregulator ArsR/SmtB family transcription factor [Candidatus Diapherotrites archaeon]
MGEAYRLFFKSFSNRTRFEIIQLLRKDPRNVTEICKATGFEQSRISHNLKCLEDCGFVSPKKDGKKRIYSLDGKYIAPILDDIDKYIERYGKGLKSCGRL